MLLEDLGGLKEKLIGKRRMQDAPVRGIAMPKAARQVVRRQARAAQINLDPIARRACPLDAAAAVVVSAAAHATPPSTHWLAEQQHGSPPAPFPDQGQRDADDAERESA
jgi:hypothetical protein